MPAAFITPIIGGLAGLFGGGRQQTQQGSFNNQQTQSGTGSTTSTGTSTNSTTPNLSPIQQQLMQLFSQGASNLFNQAQDLTGYTGTGLQNINQGTNAAVNNIKNAMAARGLTYSPASFVPQTMATLAGANQQNQFLNNLPLLQTQLKQNALSGLIQAFGVLPTGVTQSGSQSGGTTTNFNQTGSSSGSQKGTISGNPWGGFVSGLGAGLMSPSRPGGPSNLSNILGSLGF